MARRLYPHNLEAEAALIGACLLRPDGVGQAIEQGIKAEAFYKPFHASVWSAIESLYGQGETAEAIAVAEELKRQGSHYDKALPDLLKIESETPSMNIDRYVSIVDEHYLLRRVISTANEIAEEGLEIPLDVRGFLDDAESKFFVLGQERATDSVLLAQVAALEEVKRLETKRHGLKTGLPDLDRILGGFYNSNLVVLGARPAAGKTASALQIARNMAAANTTTLFFSLEMSHEELAQRSLALTGEIPISNLRNDLFEKDWFKIKEGLRTLEGLPLYFDDNPLVTINEMRAKARRTKNLGMIVVDYIQLMTSQKRAETRQNEVAEISRSLKILAREIKVPILALSQLSRNLESRPEKRPNLSDLRESGSIEQDSDVVIFLYRDEIYNPDTPDKGITEFIVAKHRNGPLGKARLAFLPRLAKFAEIAD